MSANHAYDYYIVLVFSLFSGIFNIQQQMINWLCTSGCIFRFWKLRLL